MRNKRALEIDRRANFRASSEKLNLTKHLVGFWRDLGDSQRCKYDALSAVQLLEKLKLEDKPISRAPVLNFVRVEASQNAQLLGGRGAVLDQIYITPELRTHQMLRRVLAFIEYQAALVGAIMLDIKFTFKDKREPAFEPIGFENQYSFMSKQLEPWPTYYRRSRLSE